MAKYVVNEGKAVNAGEGLWYQAGESIELSENDASGLVENGTISPVAAPAPKGKKGDDSGI